MNDASRAIRITQEASLEDRFAVARARIRSFGAILPIYSSAIRAVSCASTILKTRDSELINNFAVTSVKIPVRISPTITNAFFCAADELYPVEFGELNENGDLKLDQVLKLFQANEIAAVLGITYFFRLLSKRSEPQEFARLAPIMAQHLRLGALVGAHSGSIFGRGGGMTATGLRCLGIAALINSNISNYKKYRRLIEDSNELSHKSFELNNFGCTHLDMASVLAGELGFGSVAREAFMTLQTGQAKESSPERILWQHALIESSKMFATSDSLKARNTTEKNCWKPEEALNGYTWLWGHSSSKHNSAGGSSDCLKNANLKNSVSQTTADIALPKTLIIDSVPTINQSVLIVEDDTTSALILERKLKSLGTITICESAESAMALLDTKEGKLPFDLILLDVGLPGISGLNFLNNLRKMEASFSLHADERSKVLMITGDDSPETVMKAFSHGADGYLTKPLKKEEIAEELLKHNIILTL